MVRCGALFATILLIANSSSMASEFNGLLTRVPGGANAIMLIDVEKTLATPLAKQNGWDRKLTEGGADRPMYLPPEADKVVVAVQVDMARGFRRSWETAVMGLTEQMPMRLIARAEGGSLDEINGVQAVLIPSDAYFVEIDKNILGLAAPADRQAVGRWINGNAGKPSLDISDYLDRAASAMSQGPHVVIALDSANALQVQRITQRLEETGFAAKHNLDIPATADLIAGLQGLVLEIQFTEKAEASARIDFSAPVPLNATVARALVLRTLDTLQMSLPGLEDWKYSVVDKAIVARGPLSNDAMRRIFSLMELPSTKFSSLKEANVEEASGDDLAKNSMAYFKSVDALVKDLKDRAKSSNSDAYWIDRYASRIDRLPILHVDDDLLQYGEKLSETLRIMSGSRKMSNLQGGAASRNDLNQGGVYYGSGNGYGSYSYSTARTRERNAGVDRANAAASGTVTKLEGWNLIDNATVDIRREMTKRYNVEF